MNSCASYDKPFKLVARNMQIHKVIFGSRHVICDTLTLCTRPSRLLCAALEKLETDYHGARKAVTHNNIRFLHNKNLADATSNYTNCVAASGQVTNDCDPKFLHTILGFWFFVVLFCHLISS